MQKTDFAPGGAPPNGHDAAPQTHCRVDVLANGAHLHLTQGGPTGPFIGMVTYNLADPRFAPLLAQKLTEWLMYQAQQVKPVTGAAAQQAVAEATKAN